ncbi:MAG: oligosaccharide flippase family protein [Gaiellaceae bacterium]
MSLAFQIRRLARHSAIYGIGGILSRVLAVLLLPLYTSYLGTAGFGKIELVTALNTVLMIVLSAGISSAFFRFYFDSKDESRRTLIVRTAFWFTMTMATIGLVLGAAFATPITHALGLGDDPWLIRAAAVGLWAQMNYQQLTNLFRVEERSVQFVIASVANILITVAATVLLVVGLHKGATGAVVGNFVGTLAVYLVLLAYRRYQLGLQFDTRLLREMNRFGLPLVPSALALWAITFIDRLFLNAYKGASEVGVYSLAVRVSSVIVFLMIAFRLAWPAFAYSIDDESTAKRTYSYVLTYLLFVCCWISIALGTLAPWLVQILAPSKPAFYRADEAVGVLSFGTTAYAGYTVLAIGIGRARQTQFNWIVSGIAATVNVALNFALIPPYGMMGAAISTAAAYVALFLGMSLNSQRVYPVAYQWRRVLTLSSVAIVLTAIGFEVRSLPLSIALCVVYPLLLLPLGFYLPAERARLRRLVPS